MLDVRKQSEILDKINNKWLELQKNFYICYNVKELAYKVANDILEQIGRNEDIYLDYKYNNKNGEHIIIFELEENIYLRFSIVWDKGFISGDSGLRIRNGKIIDRVPRGYADIEEIIQDEDLEEY